MINVELFCSSFAAGYFSDPVVLAKGVPLICPLWICFIEGGDIQLFRMKTFFSFCFTWLFCNFAHAQLTKDTVFFTNGTIVIGKLLKIRLGTVTFDPDDANDISVQLRKVRTLATGNRIFRIETVDDNLYFGKILSHPDQKEIYIKRGTDTVALAMESISIMYPFDETTLQRFSGTVGLGYNYTRSSGLGRLNFDTDIRYTSWKTEVTFSFSAIYTIYDSLFSRDNESLNMKYNYYYVRNWFVTAFLAYQRNLELGLQRRYQEGFGLGNKFITGRSVYSWGRTGLVFNEEMSTEQIKSGLLVETFGQLEINLFKFAKRTFNFQVLQTFYYSLSQNGRFRTDGSVNVKWEVFKNFYLNLQPYNNYDSKPPVSGSRFDYGVVFGIDYKFY